MSGGDDTQPHSPAGARLWSREDHRAVEGARRRSGEERSRETKAMESLANATMHCTLLTVSLGCN